MTTSQTPDPVFKQPRRPDQPAWPGLSWRRSPRDALRAVHGWLVESEAFVERIRSQVQPPRHQDEIPASRRLASLDSKTVIATVAEYYGIDSDQFRVRRSRELSRDVAAWLCRRPVSGTLRELAPAFGVAHPDSVRNLVRRVDRALSTSASLQKDVETLRDQLTKTANRV